MFVLVLSLPVQAELTLYAQLTMGLMSADNGEEDLTTVVDNDAAASRFGVLASWAASPRLRLGAQVEYEAQYNPSNEVDLVGNDHISPEGLRERHLQVFARGYWGKLSVGRSDGAANGNLQRDLSGTAIVSFADPERIGGRLNFQGADTPERPEVADTIRDQDFEHRYSRIRYDVPKFGSLATSISYGRKQDNDVYEIGMRFGADYAIGKMRAAAGYSLEDLGGAEGDNVTTGGSFSFLSPQGVSLTLAYSIESDEDPLNPDSKFGMAKLGYQRGKHAFSLSYAQNNDRALLNDESQAIAAAWVMRWSDRLDLFAGYKRHELNRAGADFEPVDIGMLGARYRFRFNPFEQPSADEL